MTRNILIADDTAFMRVYIRETLTKAGFLVVGEASDGESAIAMYRQKQPDLIVLNLVMPNTSGIDTLREIKAWDPDAKVLVCSALAQAPTVVSAIKSGACEFLAKPFDPQRLVDTLYRALGLNQNSAH